MAWLTVLFALGCAARRFDYLVTESAPLGYPIEVIRPDGTRTVVPREVRVWAR